VGNPQTAQCWAVGGSGCSQMGQEDGTEGTAMLEEVLAP